MQIDNFLVLYLITARLIELVISYKNTKELLKFGAVEYYSFHYKLIVLFHSFFITYFFVKSLLVEKINFDLLILFFLIQILRYKILFDLGKSWTTRIIVMKNKPLVKNGLYKYFKHPNYFVVFIEVLLICMIFFDYKALLYFSIINLLLIFIRIYYEDKANNCRPKK